MVCAYVADAVRFTSRIAVRRSSLRPHERSGLAPLIVVGPANNELAFTQHRCDDEGVRPNATDVFSARHAVRVGRIEVGNYDARI
jgi:hypothetical protein